MKKEELLAMGINEDNANKIANLFEKTIPYSRFQEVVEEKNSLKELLASRDKQLKDLEKGNKDNEELAKQIKELQEANTKTTKEFESKLANMKLENEIKLALTESGARDSQLVMQLVDKSILKFENEKLIGLEEQINTLKKDRDYLFQAQVVETPKGATPNVSNSNTNVNTSGFMTYEQIVAQMNNE